MASRAPSALRSMGTRQVLLIKPAKGALGTLHVPRPQRTYQDSVQENAFNTNILWLIISQNGALELVISFTRQI